MSLDKSAEIDWSKLNSAGRDFENLCKELLERHGYEVRSTRGGPQYGRDLVATKPSGTPITVGPVAELWVECKFHDPQARNPKVQEKHVREALNRFDPIGPASIVIATNTRLTNSALEFLRRCNGSRTSTHFTSLEGDRIERFLLDHPDLLEKFFGIKANEQTDTRRERERNTKPGVQFNLAREADGNYRLLLFNSDLLVHTVTYVCGRESRQVILNPLETKEVHETVAPTTVHIDQNKTNEVATAVSLAPTPVDYLYADPGGLLDATKAAHANLTDVLVVGAAGAGKSRFIHEVTRGWPSRWVIDLADSDYSYRLVDHLLAAVLGSRPGRILDFAWEEVKVALDRLRGLGEEQVEVLRRYFDATAEAGSDRALLHVVAILFTKAVGDAPIVIDNLHKATDSDVEILADLRCRLSGGQTVIAMRSPADGSPAGGLLERARACGDWWMADLNVYAPADMIKAFLDRAVQDEESRRALSKLQGVSPLQQFFLTLTLLRQAGLLHVHPDGRIVVQHVHGRGEDPTALGFDVPAAYREVVDQLVQRAAPKRTAEVHEVLDCLAIFGRRAAEQEIFSVAGFDASGVIDILIDIHLLRLVRFQTNGDRVVEFDHELTQTAIYARISISRRQRLHRKCHDLIRFDDEPADPSVLRTLARHARGMNDRAASAEYGLGAGRAFKARARWSDALTDYDRARSDLKRIFASHRSHDSLPAEPAIEGDILVERLQCIDQVRGVTNAFEDIRELDVFAVRTGRWDAEIYAQYYLAKYFEAEFDADRAEKHYQNAERAARSRDHNALTAMVGSQYANFYKSRRRAYVRAFQMQRQAAKLYWGENDLAGWANAWGRLGAVLIEAKHECAAVAFYRQARDAARDAKQPEMACFRFVSSAYLDALVDPEYAGAGSQLEAALIEAQQLGLTVQEIRASINLANFLHFDASWNGERAWTLARQAERLADEIGSAYLRLLARFSLWMFEIGAKPPASVVHGKRGDALIDEIFQILPQANRYTMVSDRRLANMLRFLLRCGDDRAICYVRNTNDTALLNFLTRTSQDPAYVEYRNIYARDERYVTYY